MSFLRSVGERKKTRVLGAAQMVQRSADDAVDLDAKAALSRQLIPLGWMHVQELLDAEVESLAGPADPALLQAGAVCCVVPQLRSRGGGDPRRGRFIEFERVPRFRASKRRAVREFQERDLSTDEPSRSAPR